jgi:hypothetical protein
MKVRILIVTALLVAAPLSQALADKNIGCGWGTMLWKGQRGLAPKVLGATTNGTSGNQTFGITTGTGGCSQEGAITADARLNMFASSNIDRLARDMAVGQGETLDTLAFLMGIDDTDRPVFYGMTKAHFGEIFATSEVTAGQMLENIARLMADDAELSKYVNL